MKRFTILLLTGLFMSMLPATAQNYSFTNYVIPVSGFSDSTVLTSHINTIAQDANGYLWFGCGFQNKGAAIRYDGTQWKVFTKADGLAGNCVRDIAIDAHQFMWFATSGGISGGEDDNIFLQLTPDDGLVSACVSSIHIDRMSNVWFGCGEMTHSGGISILDGTEWEWTSYTAENGLAGTWVTDIGHDAAGNIWVSYFGFDGEVAGVSKFDGTGWTGYTTEDGLADKTVWAIASDKGGTLWFGTSGGVSRYDGKKWTTYTMLDGLADNRINAISIDNQDHIWFGTHKGVTRFDGRRWTSFTTEDGLLHNNVRTILTDADGTLWFGTDAGISRLKFHHTNMAGSADPGEALRIYPNPGKGLITIELGTPGEALLDIRDMHGRLLRSRDLYSSMEHVDLHDLRGGVYLFRISQAGTTRVERVILQ